MEDGMFEIEAKVELEKVGAANGNEFIMEFVIG